MKRYLISIPVSIHVWIEAEDMDDIDEDVVFDAILDEHGPTIHLKAKDITNDFDIIDEEEIT